MLIMLSVSVGADEKVSLLLVFAMTIKVFIASAIAINIARYFFMFFFTSF